MANQWHYKQHGQQIGPVTDQRLKQLADSGQLQPSDTVQRVGTDQWVAAGRLKGLFAVPVAVGTSTPRQPESNFDAPPPLPPNEPETGLDIASLTGTSSAPSAGSSSSPQMKGKSLLGSLASRAKTAGLLIAKQTERTKLLNVTLPHHYHCLGKHLFGSRQYADEFATLYQNIDALLGQIKTLETGHANEPKAEGIAAKATAAAKTAQYAVQGKTLKMKLGHALAELGKAAFEKHGEGSGQEELIRPIANAKLRAEQLATEIAQISKASAGQILTPKRIAIGGVAVVCVVLVAIFFGRSVTKELTPPWEQKLDPQTCTDTAKKCITYADSDPDEAVKLLRKTLHSSFASSMGNGPSPQQVMLDAVATLPKADQDKFAVVWKKYKEYEKAADREERREEQQYEQREQQKAEREHQEKMKPNIIIIPKN